MRIDKCNWNLLVDEVEHQLGYNRVYHCVCPKCKKDFMEYICGTEIWYMTEDNLPNYCPNCGDNKI